MADKAAEAPRPELLIFVKAPRPGAVKTRLGAAIGDDLAAEVYRALTTAVMKATEPVGGEYARVVCFAPADAEGEVAAWLGREHFEAQTEGDLGARMDRAFANSFGRGSTATVIIGTDAPGIDYAAVRTAFGALATADLVLRSADDGGYSLVGLKHRETSLFADMVWSTDTVMATTLARATAARLSVVVQGPDGDIDTVEDLRRLWPEVLPLLDAEAARRIEDATFSGRPA